MAEKGKKETAKDFESQTQILKVDDTAEVISLRKCLLVVLEGDDKGKKYSLNKNITNIGKKEDNDIILSDKAISRQHAEIEYKSDSFLLKDLESTNGTYVNGTRVKAAYLLPGDRVKIGRTVMEFTAYDEKVKIDPSDKTEFGKLVGSSAKMRQIFTILERISPTLATVVVEGGTGTGKDLVAQAIHEHSPRRNRPFVVFDCSAVAPNLIESELFGHEKGAFTGAIKSRKGAFEEANTGTIFLDEIGEMTLDLQPKLLRALEQREIKRVGSNSTSKIDVRIVCATNKILRNEVKEGRFREDLYYRLSVVKIRLPSLAERPEDIEKLIERFLTSSKFNLLPDGSFKVTKVDDDALKTLKRYLWPGNVRELLNVVERSISFAEGDTITKSNLNYVFSEMDQQEEYTERLPPSADMPFKDAKQQVVEHFEKEYLEELLKRNNYNISAAAREAKIDRKHIRNLLKKYGIKA